MVILADSTPVFEKGAFRPDRVDASASLNHDEQGQNVLFLDGHVAWADRADVGVSQDNIFLSGTLRSYRGDERPAGPTDSFLLPAYTPATASRR